MENVINKYETIIVVDAALTEDEINATVEKFKALISANGTIENVDVWGKRKLAYPINFKTEGYYVLINFASQAEFITELDRNYNIADSILRTITVRK
jgi:small subunit ribosomal protein S6